MSEQIPPESYDRRQRNEKEEKDEKDRRDQREKEEKGAGDRLGSLSWALILIMAGLVFLAVSANLFPGLDWSNAWSLIVMGAGLVIGLEVILRFLMPEYRRPLSGRLILAVVLLLVGAGGFIGWDNTWPFILIGIGLAMLVGALTNRQ